MKINSCFTDWDIESLYIAVSIVLNSSIVTPHLIIINVFGNISSVSSMEFNVRLSAHCYNIQSLSSYTSCWKTTSVLLRLLRSIIGHWEQISCYVMWKIRTTVTAQDSWIPGMRRSFEQAEWGLLCSHLYTAVSKIKYKAYRNSKPSDPDFNFKSVLRDNESSNFMVTM